MPQCKIQLTPLAFLPPRLFPSPFLVCWTFTRIHFRRKISENYEIIKKGEEMGLRQDFQSVAYIFKSK